jgi:hypothetical protein
MRLSNITYSACVLAFGFALTMPGSAYAYVNSAHVYRHVQHHATQAKVSPKNVTALALAAPRTISPANKVKETDGLSRNGDDCNDGCIDH